MWQPSELPDGVQQLNRVLFELLITTRLRILKQAITLVVYGIATSRTGLAAVAGAGFY